MHNFPDEQAERDYYSLSTEAKEVYDYTAEKHPTWSHSQLMAKVALSEKERDLIENGIDITVDDPKIWADILSGAKEILKGFGSISVAVFEAIDSALSTLWSWIKKRITYIADKLEELLNRIFSDYYESGKMEIFI